MLDPFLLKGRSLVYMTDEPVFLQFSSTWYFEWLVEIFVWNTFQLVNPIKFHCQCEFQIWGFWRGLIKSEIVDNEGVSSSIFRPDLWPRWKVGILGSEHDPRKLRVDRARRHQRQHRQEDWGQVEQGHQGQLQDHDRSLARNYDAGQYLEGFLPFQISKHSLRKRQFYCAGGPRTTTNSSKLANLLL